MFSGKVVRLVLSGFLIREAAYADLRILILSRGIDVFANGAIGFSKRVAA